MEVNTRAGLRDSCVLKDICWAVRVLRRRRIRVWAGRGKVVMVTEAASTSPSVPQAEEEFSKAQGVFEDLNQELLEELPVLYNR